MSDVYKRMGRNEIKKRYTDYLTDPVAGFSGTVTALKSLTAIAHNEEVSTKSFIDLSAIVWNAVGFALLDVFTCPNDPFITKPKEQILKRLVNHLCQSYYSRYRWDDWKFRLLKEGYMECVTGGYKFHGAAMVSAVEKMILDCEEQSFSLLVSGFNDPSVFWGNFLFRPKIDDGEE